MFKDLQFVLFFLRDFISQNSLLEVYQQLITSYEQAQGSSNEELEQTIETTRAKIIEIHTQIPHVAWTAPQIAILKRIGAYDLISSTALKRIEEIFTKKVGNNPAIIQQLQSLKSETEKISSQVNQLIQLMGIEEKTEPEDDKTQLEISFQGNAAFNNFWEIENRMKDWVFIIRAFTRLTNTPFDSVKIVSMSSGSPDVGVWLEAIKNTSEAIIAGSKAALELKKLKDVFLGKKKTVEELGLGKTTVKLTLKDLEKQYGDGRKNKIGELTLEITKKYQVKRDGANDGPEISTMLGKALDKLNILMDDGVKILDPNEIQPTAKPTETSLISQYQEIKKIDQKITPLLEAESRARTEKRLADMNKDLEEEAPINISGSNTIPQVISPKKRGRPKKSP